MNKTRIVAKVVAGTVAATALLLGTLAAPAQARDTGWFSGGSGTTSSNARDTGWF